jgi:hypothetical protein
MLNMRVLAAETAKMPKSESVKNGGEIFEEK